MKNVGFLNATILVLLSLNTLHSSDVCMSEPDLNATLTEYQLPSHLEKLKDIKPENLPAYFDSATLDSFINATMVTFHIPGLATWASKDGQVVWQQCYGWANIADSIPVADTTLFAQASISKTITATAIMQLYERGEFALSDDINDYLPFNVRNPNHPDSVITFGNLLRHTSSIDDNWAILDPLVTWGGDSPIPLDYFLQEYLVPGGVYYNPTNYHAWAPSGYWDYTNVGATLLGYLVETIEDSFPLHCQDSIFQPLSMDETSWFLADLDTNNIAVPYRWMGSTYAPYPHYGRPWYPSGQLRTSSVQLARHLTAIMQYGQIDTVRILDSTTVDTMLTVYFDIHPLLKMGLIWHYLDTGSRWIWWHNGGFYGVHTEMGFCPAENTAAIALTNGESSEGTIAIIDALFDYAQNVALDENEDVSLGSRRMSATIFRGPLRLPEGKKCRVFDITGRVVEPANIQPGIYFIEVDGVVTQKVVKVR
ncbi:MAG: serine hydrolase [candidate division WOR-3 bacterium]|nr:MAG: serine hydrolase [candidate division WOR-3 bacterium]